MRPCDVMAIRVWGTRAASRRIAAAVSPGSTMHRPGLDMPVDNLSISGAAARRSDSLRTVLTSCRSVRRGVATPAASGIISVE